MRAMAIHPAYAQVSALLVAVFILIAGNGLSNTLVPLSATAQSFPPLSIGLIGSAYFGGMLIGCLAAPRIIARAGHIRAFWRSSRSRPFLLCCTRSSSSRPHGRRSAP